MSRGIGNREPMDVMDAGRMLVAADPVGAAFGVWQAGNHVGAQVANAPGAFTWSEHMSRDLEGAKAFYAAVFGYEYGDMSSDGFSYACGLCIPNAFLPGLSRNGSAGEDGAVE